MFFMQYFLCTGINQIMEKGIRKGLHKMKIKQYHTVGTILKSNIKIVGTDKIDTPNT
jgi:hypothetical protein